MVIYVTLTKKKRFFPNLKKRIQDDKTVLASSFLRLFIWCSDIDVLYVKVLTRLQIV